MALIRGGLDAIGSRSAASSCRPSKWMATSEEAVCARGPRLPWLWQPLCSNTYWELRMSAWHSA